MLLHTTGVAGAELVADGYTYPLDGINQWDALTTPGGSSSATSSNQTRSLVHEIGGDNNIHQESFFDGRFKLMKYHPVIYNYNNWLCKTAGTYGPAPVSCTGSTGCTIESTCMQRGVDRLPPLLALNVCIARSGGVWW